MRLLKHSITNAFFIGFMSAIYSFVFIFTSDHIEFLRLLTKSQTLKSAFWNGWANFIKGGNMKYIGYIIIVLTLIILLIVLFKGKREYDEYQISILSRSLMTAGVISIIMVPIIMVMLLSDPNYTIETIFFFAAVQWCGVLVADLIYSIKN